MAQNRIKELRKNLNLTLRELKEKLSEFDISVNESQLSKWEKNLQSPRDDKVWTSLSEIFNVSQFYLMGFSNNEDRYRKDEEIFHVGVDEDTGEELVASFSDSRFFEGKLIDKITGLLWFFKENNIFFTDKDLFFVIDMIDKINLNGKNSPYNSPEEMFEDFKDINKFTLLNTIFETPEDISYDEYYKMMSKDLINILKDRA